MRDKGPRHEGRKDPRFSVAKLAEYTDARSAARRERIMLDQKFVPAYKSAIYRQATSAIVAALCDGRNVATALQAALDRLETQRSGTLNAQRDARCSIAAIRQFQLVAPHLFSPNVRHLRPVRGLTRVDLSGVDVSVAAQTCVRLTSPSGLAAGALLLIFSKDRRMSAKEGAIAAMLLRQSVLQAVDQEHAAVRNDLCKVVDVFRGTIFVPPTRDKRLMDDVISSCREIVRAWPWIGGDRSAA